MSRAIAATWGAWAAAALVAGSSLWWLLAAHPRTPNRTADEATAVDGPAADPTGGLHWNDPSISPEILTKAFAPPPTDLPLEARPVRPNIDPPDHAFSRSQRVR